MTCPFCRGSDWVCEEHHDRPMGHEGCGGAGMPCPQCQIPGAKPRFQKDQPHAGLRRYNDHAGPEPIGEMWKATLGTRTIRCAVATHRLGWELRLSVGDELMRSQVCKTQNQVFDASEAWQAEANQKGWS